MNARNYAVTEDAKEERKKSSANVENNAVAAYFRSMGKYKLLTADEEKDLIAKAQKGDRQAREAVITANLRLSVYIAKKYLRKVSHLKMGDLIQVGNEGLVKAVEGFNPAKMCRFSTYATYWIRSALERELGDHEDAIRNPIYVIDGLKRYKKEVHLLARKLGRRPSVEEIAAEREESVAWVKEKENLSIKYISLDAPISENGDDSRVLGDFIEGSDGTEAYMFILHSEFKKKLAEIFRDSLLNEKEKEVLRSRYGIESDNGEELTLEEIAARFGLTRERIRQIEERALQKLRKRIGHLKGLLS